MATVQEDLIETFMNITGASEAVALQRLAEHGGDINRALDAYFNDGDRASSHPANAQHDDLMVIDELVSVEPQRSSLPLLSAARDLNPFRLLDSFGENLFDRLGGSISSSREPYVSHPREVREIPIEVKGEADNSDSSRPIIEDITESTYAQGPEAHGTVIIDEEDDEDTAIYPQLHQSEKRHAINQEHARSSVPESNGTLYDDDIEEEMLQAAIEASKQEAEAAHYVQQELSLASRSQSHPLDDMELAKAVSLSLKAAEQEKTVKVEPVAMEGDSTYDVEELQKLPPVSARQGSIQSDKLKAFQSKVVVNLEDENLHKESSKQASKFARAAEKAQSSKDSPSLPQPCKIDNNGNVLPEEWGSISTEEHDEAIMLEAALFGGLPEGSSYHYGYQQMQNGDHQQTLHPLSPSLVAHRLLREQQDDEYLASLQADIEKEQKAREEAEAAEQKVKLEAEEVQRRLIEEKEAERRLAEKEASLPPEPAPENPRAVTILVRMPDGSRHGRRFLSTDKLRFLFDFIDVGKSVKAGTYRLVRPYPWHAFSDGENDLTFIDLGLTSKQEALFLELI